MKTRFVILVWSALLLFLTSSFLHADFKLAVAYYNQGKFDKALEELKPDLEKNPDWEFGHRLAGLCHLGLKSYGQAITELNRAVQLKSTTFSTYMGLAEAYLQQQQHDKVLEA